MLALGKRFAASTLIYRFVERKKLTIGCKIHKQDAKKLKDAVSALCARHGGGGGGEDGEEREDTEKSEVMKKDFGKKYIFLKGGEAEGIP